MGADLVLGGGQHSDWLGRRGDGGADGVVGGGVVGSQGADGEEGMVGVITGPGPHYVREH